MSAQSNGFLATILTEAARDTSHTSHDEATSYLTKFRSLEDTFFRDVHPHVDVGLAIREVQVAARGKPNIFTIHGCRHIADLIRSLDKLAQSIGDEPRRALDVLEAYILLCAAHVHDAANVKKREGHAERCSELMEEYKALFASPAAMQQAYWVASVHGGVHSKYGKDTIRSLDIDNSQQPRLPMLAAMLRIGDELSENPERVPELVARHHEHSGASKLAFAYARSFQTFELRKDNLYLTYGVYPDAAALRASVSGQTVGFFDFLEGKLDVIDREARYCSQYGWPDFHIGRVKVNIRLFEHSVPSPVKETLDFGWPLHGGYPSTTESMCQRSPELRDKGAETLAGCFKQVGGEGPHAGGWLRRLRGLRSATQ